MQRKFYNIFFVITLFFLAGCGGGRKLVKNPQPLGIVPFAGAELAGEPQELNRVLLNELRGSGAFLVRELDTIPAVWDLERLKADPDSLVQWILTGEFLQEYQVNGRGTLIPFTLFKPYVGLRVKIHYRLYSREKQGWADIGDVVATVKKGGGFQVIDYDEAHPRLMLDARQRQIMREAAYQKAVRMLVKKIAAKMKIK